VRTRIFGVSDGAVTNVVCALKPVIADLKPVTCNDWTADLQLAIQTSVDCALVGIIVHRVSGHWRCNTLASGYFAGVGVAIEVGAQRGGQALAFAIIGARECCVWTADIDFPIPVTSRAIARVVPRAIARATVGWCENAPVCE